MTISYNWLKQYLPRLPQPEKLAELLTLHSFEVEKVSKAAGDWILEVDILPNRAHDCLSHLGIAREIAAISGAKLKIPQAKIKEEKPASAGSAPKASSAKAAATAGKSEEISDILKVKIADSKLCPRYTARTVKDIKIKESPAWLKNYLKAVGIRPINNVVDITNYLMLETGQPTHAFDYDKIKGHQITVRSAKSGEKVTTLDGQTHKLDKGIIIIEDSQRLIDLAGIMGGANSQISEKTKTVVLQAATFNPLNIRRACQKLGVRTDASDRYEREISPSLADFTLERGTFLLQQLADGKVVKGIIDIYPKKKKPVKIKLDLEKVDRLLGFKVTAQKIVNILESLECKVRKGKTFLEVTVPDFRLDLNIVEDLIEEIARIYGYDNINSIPPRVKLALVKEKELLKWQTRVKDILSGAGFSEVYNYSFTDWSDKQALELENPMNFQERYLRTSLIPNLLKNVQENLKHFEQVKIFEIGQVYRIVNSGKSTLEKKILAGLADDFYEVKGITELLFAKMGLDLTKVNYQLSSSDRFFQPGQSALIKISNQLIGTIGQINHQILNKLGIKKPIAAFDIDFEKLAELSTTQRTYIPISKYPSIVRDIALLVDEKITWQEIKELVKRTGGSLVQKVELFDFYQGKEIPQGKRNLAFHIVYQSEGRTLKEKDIKLIQEKIIKSLEGKGEVRK